MAPAAPPPPSPPTILIVGAGPTGLCLAIWLKTLRPSLSVRVVDRAAGTGASSRAIVLHARLLEHYAQLGVADAIIAAGQVLDGVAVATDGIERGKLVFGRLKNSGGHGGVETRFPFVLTLPQDVHEAVLLRHLRALGGDVEWGSEVVGVEAAAGEAVVKVMVVRAAAGAGDVKGETEEIVEAAFLAGCDGARSAVRKLLGVQMRGDRFPTRFYVADTVLRDQHSALTGLRLCLGSRLFGAALPMGMDGDGPRLRTLGMVPADCGEEVKFEDFADRIEDLVAVKFKAVRWSSIYSVYHRVASKFRMDRVFLLGDAAHLHSPVGGQGMNTGLGDAANLAWKLVAALEGNADPELLDSYDAERRSFAEKLVSTTDRVFNVLIYEGWLGFLFRRVIMAFLVPLLWKLPFVPPRMFLLVSQLGLSYRHCAPKTSDDGSGSAGSLRVGDRLPWTGSAGVDNHATLQNLAFEIHRYSVQHGIENEEEKTSKPPVRLFSLPNPARYGFDPKFDYLIRPDGYIAAITPRKT